MENKQERTYAHCAACQDVGCGRGAPPCRYLICCVFIDTLIWDLVLWEGLLLHSHYNNGGSRVVLFSAVTNIKPDHVACPSAIKWDMVQEKNFYDPVYNINNNTAILLWN